MSKVFFLVGLLVKIFKVLLPYSIMTTYSAQLNLVDVITVTILRERYEL